MSKQPKTYSLETNTVEAIERLAEKTRRSQSAIIDLAVELYDKIMAQQLDDTPAAIMRRLGSPEIFPSS
jgi:predicted transcriptional regulator